jgi:hypothetical protein
VGCTGTVIVATRGEQGPGEVLVKVRGGTEAYLAWSEQPLANANINVLNGADGLGQLAAGLVGQGLSIFESIKSNLNDYDEDEDEYDDPARRRRPSCRGAPAR